MGDRKYIYKNELNKACFQHDMTYGDFKDLTKRTASNKVLREKAFKIARNQKYDGYQRGLASMVYKFVDNYTNQLLENFKKEKYIHHLKIVFGMLILQICN